MCSVFLCAEKCCADLMSMAKEARKHKLGPLHPAFNLLQIVRESMEASLPEDAHVRASGKLCVSLTRVSDRKNVLVSQFDSRDELIEVYFTTSSRVFCGTRFIYKVQGLCIYHPTTQCFMLHKTI